MNIPDTKLTKEERKLVTLKAQEARDRVFKLVVKIIRWETESSHSANNTIEKITSQEWAKYKQHLLNISTSESTQKVKDKLTQTYNAIKEHGGFK